MRFIIQIPRTPTQTIPINARVNFAMSGMQRFIDVMMTEWVSSE